MQERNQNREALEAVKGPLGDAYNLEGERDLMVASLTVCPLLFNCAARRCLRCATVWSHLANDWLRRLALYESSASLVAIKFLRPPVCMRRPNWETAKQQQASSGIRLCITRRTGKPSKGSWIACFLPPARAVQSHPQMALPNFPPCP